MSEAYQIPYSRAKELAIKDAERRFKFWDEAAKFWTDIAREVGDVGAITTMNVVLRCRSISQDEILKINEAAFIGGHWLIEAQREQGIVA